MQPLQLLAINLTEKCNMACAHCYLDAKTLQHGAADELSSAEVCQVMDDVASLSKQTMVVLTGGEPLLRADLEQLIAHGSKLGLSMVVGTNGMALTDKRVRSLKQAGLLGVGISIDSLDPDKHDRFRGLKGSWLKTVKGIDTCRRRELSFQLHFTITRQNHSELKAIAQFASDAGARVLNIFFLVCIGRGRSVQDVDASTYEACLQEMIALQVGYPRMIIRARCAPQYKRVAHQLNPQSRLNKISGMVGDGCIAGIHYARVSPNGTLTACPYIEKGVGNIRQQSLIALWQNAPQFLRLRQPKLTGRCGQCEYQLLCGGCRARPMALSNDLMAEDPFCHYIPKAIPPIKPPGELQFINILWDSEAKQRLAKIPGFLQKMIKQRAEAYVSDLGETCVKAEHLHLLAAKRFGNKPPSFLTKIRSEQGE